ncbi:MAG: TraR/DksA C4-type zinc finger protein [Candidatus Sumerlaeia bacterium]|nr:TraR/DksA C4-type zinc finger protein [Candidatus Sumerlaeia bacterium]
MLTDSQRGEIRQIIVEMIAEVDEEVVAMKEQTQPVAPDSSIGRLSRMDNLVNKETVQLALDEAMKRRNRLREKLGRIDEADFGRCPMCQEMIPMERLRVAPDRGVCVKCLNNAKASKR